MPIDVKIGIKIYWKKKINNLTSLWTNEASYALLKYPIYFLCLVSIAVATNIWTTVKKGESNNSTINVKKIYSNILEFLNIYISA
jgi:hypothetical protein